MIVRFTVRAQRRAEAVDRWWREHRPEAPELFKDELAAAQRQVLTSPNSGTLHCRVAGKLFRRVLVPSTRQWLYYRVDASRNQIVIHTIWGAQRGRDPALP